MDGFSYSDIFATKGIEYLIIITFFLVLIPFWMILNKQVEIKEKIRKVLGILSAKRLKIPQGIFHSKNHTWTYLEKSGVASIGLDDLLLHITGEVTIHHLREAGEEIRKGDLLAEIDQNVKSLQVFSPVSGKIICSNPDLTIKRDLLTEDPYGKGWMYKIKPTNWIAEISDYYLAEETTEWLNLEVERYKDFLATNARKYAPENAYIVLQDGGEISENSLSEMPQELWSDFQNEFLNPK